MNRSVINQWSAEFNYWATGGKVLCTSHHGEWIPVDNSGTEFEEASIYRSFILNDDMVEIRKAFIDGRIVQAQRHNAPCEWESVNPNSTAFLNRVFNQYRILNTRDDTIDYEYDRNGMEKNNETN